MQRCGRERGPARVRAGLVRRGAVVEQHPADVVVAVLRGVHERGDTGGDRCGGLREPDPSRRRRCHPIRGGGHCGVGTRVEEELDHRGGSVLADVHQRGRAVLQPIGVGPAGQQHTSHLDLHLAAVLGV